MENNNQKKEVTIDDLALIVAKGFNEVNEKMAKGFNEVNEKMDKGFKDVKDELRTEIIEAVVEAKNELKAELNKKVDIFKHNDLEYRVEKLESKVGVTLKKNLAVA